MNILRKMIMTFPLVLALSGPAAASIAESGADDLSGGAPVAIDRLLESFSDLAPGEIGSVANSAADLRAEGLSAFTASASPMSSYYTVFGSGSEFHALGHDRSAHSGDAEGPAVGRITVAHHVQDIPVNPIAAGISPTDSGLSLAPQTTTTTTNGGDNPGSGTIITGDTTLVTPIPAALYLLGTGLAFLAPLARKNRLSSP